MSEILSENAKKILEKRYFLKNDKGEVVEDWEGLCSRVATFVSGAEKNKELRDTWQSQFYEMIHGLEFLPSSPTLFNAGTENPQLNACFVIDIQDNIESIGKAVADSLKIYKSGGGVGYYLGHLRPAEAMVNGTGGISSGPLSFMKIYDVAVEVIKQGSKRRGAALGALPIHHPDILPYITCKNDKKSFENFNLSVGITNEFMKAVERDEMFELKHPRGQEVKKIKAKTLWNKICKSAHSTGDPGMLFIDNINKFNPIPGNPLNGTNPCGEQPLNSHESCVLGSINLTKFVKEDDVDYKRLEYVVANAIRFLDNTIDLNKYPTDEIRDSSRSNRKVGLGVMGYADMLIMLGMKYDSEEAIKFADQLMNFINKAAYKASVALGEEKGNFPNFDQSIFAVKGSKSHKRTPFLRNATRTTIAPTGTISIIANVSSGIEPVFAFEYARESVGDKVKLDWIHPLYEQALAENDGKLPKKLHPVFVSAHEIDYEYHVKTQHAFQLHTDNAVSKTINLPAKTPIKTIKHIYEWAYSLGLKGITVFRDGCRNGKQVLKHKRERCPECGKYSLERGENCITCRACGWSKCEVK